MLSFSILWMHIRNGTFRWKMVKDYFLGHFRYFLFLYAPYLLKQETYDRSVRRLMKSREVCMKQKQCIKCGCSMPQLLFTDDGCKVKCHDDEETELGI